MPDPLRDRLGLQSMWPSLERGSVYATIDDGRDTELWWLVIIGASEDGMMVNYATQKSPLDCMVRYADSWKFLHSTIEYNLAYREDVKIEIHELDEAFNNRAPSKDAAKDVLLLVWERLRATGWGDVGTFP